MDSMRLEGGRSHGARETIVIVGIFSAFAMSAFVPQSALSQFTAPVGTGNQSSAGINIPPNDSSAIPVPNIIFNPANGVVIRDPGGDDVFTKDCAYAGKVYSPGSTVTMPNAGESGGADVKTCRDTGNWE